MSKLGKYLSLDNSRNSEKSLNKESIVGISTKKEFIDTKGDLTFVDVKSYKVVKPRYFAYVEDTSRRGDRISLAFNSLGKDVLVSSISKIFYVKDETKLLPEYLFMYFNRPEFDRYSRFNSWGSARETFSFEDLCDIEIDVPPLEKQQQAVNVYLALVENQKKYEKGLDDLKLTCDAYIEELRRNKKPEPIGRFIEQSFKNFDNKISKVLGIGQSGFITPQKTPNESLANYKVVNSGDIVYAPPLYNILSDAFGCFRGDESIVVSPIYEVFNCKNNIIPEYLLMWLKRSEFKRYAEFHSAGVRNTFDFQLMKEVAIPIVDLEIQKSIANIHDVYNKRKQINEKLKQYISEACPILIRGSLNV